MLKGVSKSRNFINYNCQVKFINYIKKFIWNVILCSLNKGIHHLFMALSNYQCKFWKKRKKKLIPCGNPVIFACIKDFFVWSFWYYWIFFKRRDLDAIVMTTEQEDCGARYRHFVELDGNSAICAHVSSESGNLVCLGLLFIWMDSYGPYIFK